MSPDEQQIRDLVATWMSATRAGDIDKVLSLMTDDVVFLVPGQSPFGKQEFAATLRAPAGLPMPQIDGRSEIQEIRVLGDWAYMWTKLSVEVTPAGGWQAHEARRAYTLGAEKRGRPLAAGARRQPAHAGRLTERCHEIQGSCHCGKVAIEVEGEITGAVSCNCSICSKRGSLLWFVPREQIKALRGETELTTYTFNKHVIKHRFCKHCGVLPFGEGTDPRALPRPRSTSAAWKISSSKTCRCITSTARRSEAPLDRLFYICAGVAGFPAWRSGLLPRMH